MFHNAIMNKTVQQSSFGSGHYLIQTAQCPTLSVMSLSNTPPLYNISAASAWNLHFKDQI